MWSIARDVGKKKDVITQTHTRFHELFRAIVLSTTQRSTVYEY